MQTFRTLLLAAIKHVLLVWGLVQILLTFSIGHANGFQLTAHYSLGFGLVILHFLLKAGRSETVNA